MFLMMPGVPCTGLFIPVSNQSTKSGSGIQIKLFFTILLVLLFAGCGETKRNNKESSETAVEKATNASTKIDSVRTPEYMSAGKQVYVQNCLVCHQATGSGVSGLNPPLKNTLYVTGDTDQLLAILINGSNEGLVVNGSTYSNAMPAFGMLSDAEIAHVASYIRNSFGNAAAPVTSEEVSAFRSKTGK